MLHARLELDSTLDSVYKLDSLDRETRQLDTSQAHAVSLDSLDSYSTGARQARQARPRQHLDSALTVDSTAPRQRLDEASTARQLDSQGSIAVGCSRASSSSASLTRRRRGRRRTDYSRVREYADPSTRVRRNTPGGGSRAERISQASAQPQEVHPPLSIIVSHEAQDRTVKLTVAGKTAVVGRRGLSRYLALSTVSVLRHVHRCTSTHPVTARVRGGLLSSFGGFVIRIRILMYCDVSCMYPEGYMYLSCILMYLKCILNALLHSKRIHVS